MSEHCYSELTTASYVFAKGVVIISKESCPCSCDKGTARSSFFKGELPACPMCGHVQIKKEEKV